jgi:hypothetical protein
MPRFRFRLRTPLVAIGVTAVTLGCWRMWERREHHRQMAALQIQYGYRNDDALRRYLIDYHNWAASHPWLSMCDPHPVIGKGGVYFVDGFGMLDAPGRPFPSPIQ